MSATSPTQRDLIATSTIIWAVSLPPEHFAVAAESNAIRPFHINVPEADFVDLRRSLAAPRWLNKATVNDQSQGVKLAKFPEVVRYWGTNYDWRKAEAKLNALPQFVTTIHDVDIHFTQVRFRLQTPRRIERRALYPIHRAHRDKESNLWNSTASYPATNCKRRHA